MSTKKNIQKLTDLGLIDENVSSNYIQRYKELKQLHNEQICKIRWLKDKHPDFELKKGP